MRVTEKITKEEVKKIKIVFTAKEIPQQVKVYENLMF
jgi:hypothetical protein